MSLSRTSGGVISIYWSAMGDPGERKRKWGIYASRTLKGKKLVGDTWWLPDSFKFSEVKPHLQKKLGKSDKAIIMFPHGSKSGWSALMSVHRYNC